jgi:hypothetical protein
MDSWILVSLKTKLNTEGLKDCGMAPEVYEKGMVGRTQEDELRRRVHILDAGVI